jgi:hypothetical protein
MVDRAHAAWTNGDITGVLFMDIKAVGNDSGRCEKVQKRYRSLYSSGLSIYRMTRPHWPLRHRADSGPGLSGFPIKAAFPSIAKGRLVNGMKAKHVDGDLIRWTESFLSERSGRNDNGG